MATRWREKAWVPETFDSDIDEALARLAASPQTGQISRRTTRRTVYRISAPRTKLHLYYVIDELKQVVIVLQVWSQLRQGPPRL